MKMKLSKITCIAFSAIGLMSLLFASCGNVPKVESVATKNFNKGYYQQAMVDILTLSDRQIAESDKLYSMLASVYYSMQEPEDIGMESYDIDFTKDGKELIVTDFRTESLKIYSYPEVKLAREIKLHDKPYSASINESGDKVAVALKNGLVDIYDIKSGDLVKTLRTHYDPVRAVVFLGDSTLFTSSNDQHVASWNVSTEKENWNNRVHFRNAKNIKLSKDRTKIITASNDGTACILTATGPNAGKEEVRFNHGINYVNDSAITGDNSIVATVSGDEYLKIWDAKTGSLVNDVYLEDTLTAVDFSEDGKTIAVGGRGFMYVIETETGNVLNKIQLHGAPVWSIMFKGNDNIIVADLGYIWDLKLLDREELIKKARELAHEKLSDYTSGV